MRELWAARGLLVALGERDIRLRYRQTALGVAWVVLQPLVTAGVLVFAFGRVAGLGGSGVPLIVFVFAGLLGWFTFTNTVNRVSGSLVLHSALISKVYFPRLVLPLSTVLSALIDFVVGLVLLAVLMAIYGVGTTAAVLTLPLWLLLVLLLGTGVGLMAATLMVPYRDVALIVPVLTQFSLFASPVAFAMASVPGGLQRYLWCNPLSAILEGFRWAALRGTAPPLGWVAYSVACSVAVFLAGALFFRRQERRFADVI